MVRLWSGERHRPGALARCEHGASGPGIEAQAVRYPGRAERIDEPSPTDLHHLAFEIADAFDPSDERPIALFGHSVGALVALETARVLQARGTRVAHLLASGTRNAASYPPPAEAENDADDLLMDTLVGLGGTAPELAADPTFRDLVLPYVRSDALMLDTYDFSMEPQLHCPVSTIVGDEDQHADRRPWHELTAGVFFEHLVRGGHFLLSFRTSLRSDQEIPQRQDNQPEGLVSCRPIGM
ncbi:thioesterase II family protein [Streptomyces sp. 3214.6]|uniref:thioesterase II family protein n=1 Tax=Streptomyces sp. 3214.6 TaxID=1882757 RepID=UPI0009A81891|nr:alpha/beta fold hydrolase [Streptomyces sp. 3214.6]